FATCNLVVALLVRALRDRHTTLQYGGSTGPVTLLDATQRQLEGAVQSDIPVGVVLRDGHQQRCKFSTIPQLQKSLCSLDAGVVRQTMGGRFFLQLREQTGRL